MTWDFTVGIIVMGIGFGLLLVGLPRHGVSPRFLQFEAATVLYPPLILAFLVLGTASILSALF
jgi:hypothetical protein